LHLDLNRLGCQAQSTPKQASNAEACRS